MSDFRKALKKRRAAVQDLRYEEAVRKERKRKVYEERRKNEDIDINAALSKPERLFIDGDSIGRKKRHLWRLPDGSFTFKTPIKREGTRSFRGEKVEEAVYLADVMGLSYWHDLEQLREKYTLILKPEKQSNSAEKWDYMFIRIPEEAISRDEVLEYRALVEEEDELRKRKIIDPFAKIH